MSFWVYKKDKNGKTILWQIDIEPMIPMVAIGLLAAIIGPRLFNDPSIILMLPFALLGAGFVCLIISKLSLYKKGIWFSFGPKHMSKGYAKFYKTAYFLMGGGVLLLLLMLIAMHNTK